RGIARYQGASDPDVRFLTQQLVGIEHAKRQADDGCDRRESDVPLGEIQTHTEDFAPLPRAAADDTRVRDRSRIRAGARTGECEARHLFAPRKARQIVILLLFGAVVVQELRRTERVRYGNRRGRRGATARDLREYAGMRVRREFESTVLLRNDHREEAA